jgi:hypothetical protein
VRAPRTLSETRQLIEQRLANAPRRQSSVAVHTADTTNIPLA